MTITKLRVFIVIIESNSKVLTKIIPITFISSLIFITNSMGKKIRNCYRDKAVNKKLTFIVFYTNLSVGIFCLF